MKQAAMFTIVSALLIGLCAVLMGVVYGGTDERRAIAISAGLAVVVQVLAYAIVRLMYRRNVIAGWGLGAGLRFVVLAVFALVVVRQLGLPSAPATVGLALFLFISTLVEPLFLKS